MIDLHCDTVLEVLNRKEKGEDTGFVHNGLHVDLDKLEPGSLQCFALFTDRNRYNPPEKQALRLYDMYCTMLETHADKIAPVHTWSDYERNKKAGKLSALLTLEDGGVVFDDLAMLRNWARMGVRMIALTWNWPNGIGHPNFVMDPAQSYKTGKLDLVVDEEHGLTDFGLAYLPEMERLHILPDVSHLSDAGFWDVIRNAKGPVIASHSNARALCPVSRNLTDDMIQAIAKSGGVIGLNFCPDFLNQESGGKANISDMIAHLKHIKAVGGAEVLALGTDFDGITGNLEVADCGQLAKLTDAMRDAGFTREEIEGFTHANFERVLKAVLES